jgi:hypothetical protein
MALCGRITDRECKAQRSSAGDLCGQTRCDVAAVARRDSAACGGDSAACRAKVGVLLRQRGKDHLGYAKSKSKRGSAMQANYAVRVAAAAFPSCRCDGSAGGQRERLELGPGLTKSAWKGFSLRLDRMVRGALPRMKTERRSFRVGRPTKQARRAAD